MNNPTGPGASPTQPTARRNRFILVVKRAAQAALLLLIVFIIFLGASHQGRASVKAAMFIPHVFDAPVKPLEWFTPAPSRERVSFPIPAGAGIGDLYRPPGDGPFAAVVLFLGVSPAGADDDRVIRLGEALARSNMATMFYWSPIMGDGRMEAGDIHNLVAAFQYLSSQDFVDPSRVGIGGFCVGASYSIMAASQEPIRDQVSFVNAFGPYYHMPDLLASITSHTRTYDDVVQSWEPDKLTREVFVTHMTKDLPENERDLLRKAFERGADPSIVDPQTLSDEGQAVHALLVGVPREESDAYLSRLPAESLHDFDIISPSKYVADLKAQLLIMHDREDALVPAFESRRLRDALSDRDNVRYTEFGLFDHVTPEIRLGPVDTARELGKLFLHLHGILMQAT